MAENMPAFFLVAKVHIYHLGPASQTQPKKMVLCINSMRKQTGQWPSLAVWDSGETVGVFARVGRAVFLAVWGPSYAVLRDLLTY